MQRLTFDTPQDVCKKVLGGRKAKDHFVMFDSLAAMGEASRKLVGKDTQSYKSARSWTGGKSFEEACDAAIQGAPELVAKSDALLSKFEKYAFETHGRGWRDDVTGALPNVPAYIAGHPLNMRRRTRVESAAAPIAIVVDVCSSAGVTAEQLNRRGAAILALVRILSARRPVELWATCGLDDNAKNSAWISARIETAPLDLASAAFALTHAAAPRRLMYGLAEALHQSPLRYAYGACWNHRPYTGQIIAPSLPHVSESLVLPSISIQDQDVQNPEAWLEARLSELLPQDLAA